jgi:hypothetical protein
MRLGALQPGYLPWLGFFDQMARCDVFILYDDLWYARDSWRNRNRIKTPFGWCWLTVPVVNKGIGQKTIKDVEISDSTPWRRRHWKTLRTYYGRARYFQCYEDFFAHLYEKPWRYLVDLDLEIILYLARVLGLRTPILLSSQEGFEAEYLQTQPAQKDPTGRVAFLCQRLQAERFLEGALGRRFMDVSRLAALGITLEFHDYRHPCYRQLFGAFIPYLSVVDLLFNHGPESLDILTGRKRVCPSAGPGTTPGSAAWSLS